MRYRTDAQAAHLACGNQRRSGGGWQEHFADIATRVRDIRAGRLPAAAPIALSLRLTDRALAELEVSDTLTDFREWLRNNECHVVTADDGSGESNDDPSAEAIRRRTDWSDAARLAHVCRLADVLAALDPPRARASISTVPGTVSAAIDPARERAIIDHLLSAIAYCIDLERRTGVRISIAIEAAPWALHSNVEEVVQFHEECLQSMSGIRRLGRIASLSARDARDALHRHTGICHDACHSAVAFESADVLSRYAAAGIDVLKVQLGSALRIDDVSEVALRRLERLDDPECSRMVVERVGHRLIRLAGLRQAVDAARYRLDRRATLDARHRVPVAGNVALESGNAMWRSVAGPIPEWRVGFHVPSSLATAGPFDTTRALVVDLLARHRVAPICTTLEVESGCEDRWLDVRRDQPAFVKLADELDWVSRQLQ